MPGESIQQPLCQIVLELLQVGIAGVHHVAGIVVMVRDALGNLGRHVQLRQPTKDFGLQIGRQPPQDIGCLLYTSPSPRD